MVRDPMPGGSGQLYAGNDYSLGKNGENYAVCLGRLFTVRYDFSQAQSFSVHFEQQVVDAARDNVEGLVGQKLREAQIPYKKVEAVMDTSSSDSIGISKLIVTTDNPEDKIRIQKYLEEHLQIQTEVAVE